MTDSSQSVDNSVKNDIDVKSLLATVSDIEKSLYDRKDNLVVVVNRINGKQVEGIFSSISLARRYVVRLATNMSLEIIASLNEEEINDYASDFNMTTYIQENTMEYYEYEFTDDLDSSKPIYVLKNKNHVVQSYKIPSEYLTNSSEEFKDNPDWLKECTVLLDPELPELNAPDTTNLSKLLK
jgi:hypothetical protein